MIAGLKSDGIKRANGKTVTGGKQSFTLNKGGFNVKVSAPKGAFSGKVTMEAEEVPGDFVQDTVNETLAGEDNTVVGAYDISFHNTSSGAELQPSENVTVTIETLLDMTKKYTLLHIGDDGKATVVEDAVFSESGVQYTAAAFSVYAIIEGEELGQDIPYRATYEFYNTDGTKYYFKDAADNDVYTQILKDGEALEEVGIPTIGASQNAKFVGWYVWNDGSYGDKVEIGEPISVAQNKTIKLRPKMQGIVNVFFVTAVMKDDQGNDMERSVVTIKQVEYTTGQTEAITVNTKDVTTDAPTNEQAVVGWNRNETEANNGTKEGTDGVITLYSNGNVGNISDVTLFPAIKNAYWLYFDENDSGTGGGASYVPPVFVEVGGKPERPADPHRSGYTFGGWYRDPNCTVEFDFDDEMEESTTVYANWIGSNTRYSIIVKVQSTSDSARITSGTNLSHEEKSYDFWKAYTVSDVQTGGTATVANTYKQLANQIDSSGFITYETCDADKTIAADGSTVLYVYYQRRVMTIHWRNTQNGTDRATWYGLYGASFSESGKTWIEPDDGYQWRTSTGLLTFKDAFADFDNGSNSLVIYRTSSSESRYDIVFCTENLDGTWKEDQRFDFNADSYTFNEKYNAFSLYQYSRDFVNWYPAIKGESQDKITGWILFVPVFQSLYIRYSRNSYNIEYHNGTQGAEGTIVRTDSKKYEAPLSGQTNPTVTYPVAADADNYDFIGWFADSSWKTMVTFTALDEETKTNYREWYGVTEFVVIDKMPAHNFPLYAGYSLKGWDCALDPNGGEFTNPTQAGVFWLQYGKTFSSDLKTNITREGYVFQGWMKANVDGELKVRTDSATNLRFVSDDSNWTMTNTPWAFDTGIEGPTYLIAKWFYKTSMSVHYDAGAGSNAPEDNGTYSDHATTVAFHAPTAPSGLNFIGWDIDGTDTIEKLQPGDIFEVSSDYADNGVVTLKAVYHSYSNPGEEVPVTHLTWYGNGGEAANGATSYTDDDIQINSTRSITAHNYFEREGYTFIGWARIPSTDSSGNPLDGYSLSPRDLTEDDLYLKYEDNVFKAQVNGEWTEVVGVGADEKYPYHDMYAVWCEKPFYVFHSSDGTADAYTSKDLSNGKFDIASKVKDGYLYGGYFKKYFNVTDEQAKAVAGKGTAATTELYTGAALYKKVDGKTVRYWTKADAYTDTTGATGGGKGDAMTAKPGMV